MILTPTPWKAAAAGAFSALALPLVRHWLGDEQGLSLGFTVALLLVVALPAHAFVIGTGPTDVSRGLDSGLLRRIGAWLLAAAGIWALRSWM